ncbi:MAG: hypothetical protein R2705_25535 [Ilumatobacteraceae bacterium]
MEVTTRTVEGSVASVPVDWFVSDPPDWPAGTEVVVPGSVQRRFFRADAATQSRTSVLAERVASGADRRGAAPFAGGCPGGWRVDVVPIPGPWTRRA